MAKAPSAATAAEPPASLDRPVVKSLLSGKKSKEPASRPPPPFKNADSQQVSIGFVAEDETEYIFPWMHVSVTARLGEQMQLAVGQYEVTIIFDYKVAEKQGWQIAEITEAIHAQTLAWLYNRPEEGLTLKVEKQEEEQQ